MALIDFLLRDEVTITPFVHQGNGEPVYGESETRKCRIERGLHLRTIYKHPSGEIVQTTASARMFCRGDEIPVGSKVVCIDHIGKHHEMTVIDCAVATGFSQGHLEVTLE